jgi:lysophospholipase L1-like esterase
MFAMAGKTAGRLTAALLLAVSAFGVGASADELVLKQDDFKRNLHNWQIPSYWSGKLGLAEDSGRKVMKLSGATRKGKTFGRAYAEFKQALVFADYCWYNGCFSGTRMLIRVAAKGEGEFLAGLLVYHPENPRPEYLPGKAVSLTGEFAEYEFALTIPWRCPKVLPYLEVKGQGTLLVREFQLSAEFDPEVTVEPAGSVLQVVRDGGKPAPVTFRTNRPAAEVHVAQVGGKFANEAKVTADGAGVVTVEPAEQGRGLLEISAAVSGRAGMSYVIVEDAADYDRTDALAKQVKLNRPKHILILGDSLSDFYRGYNYVDRLVFWLNKYNPGKITIRNAAVHGDFVERVRDRLLCYAGDASKKVYCQERYDRLFEEKYDLIFIFLGQNDTRTPSKLNYAKPLTEPKFQYEWLTEILNFIGERSQAKVVFISPSPCSAEFIAARRAKAKPKQNFVMFGKPEFVDNYDLVNRRICEERKLDYIDILKPMRSVPNVNSLYVRDGVHLSLIGGRFIADEILKYFIAK